MEYGHAINYWGKLPSSLISEEIKQLVSADPNLSEETVARITELWPPTNTEDFAISVRHLGKGAMALSVCIQANLYASMGELTARYAERRNIPFSDSAVALTQLRREDKLCYIELLGNSRAERAMIMKWKPKDISVALPPTKAAKATRTAAAEPRGEAGGQMGDTILPPKKRRVEAQQTADLGFSASDFIVPPVLAEKPTGEDTPKRKRRNTPPKNELCTGKLTKEEYLAKKRAGIAKSVAEGRNGAKPKEIPREFAYLYELWDRGEMSGRKAAEIVGVSTPTFLKWAKAEREKRNENSD